MGDDTVMTAPPAYNDAIVQKFALTSVLMGIIGMALGCWLAAELAFPSLNLNLPWLSFGRLRPLHTNAVIFAFGGNLLFAAIYYSVQRTCRVRLWSDKLADFTYWGWLAVVLATVITLPLGYTTSHEYAEMEWPIDIGFPAVWIGPGVNYLGTLAIRKEKHIFVANWFFMALIIAVTMLHVFVSVEYPVSFLKSYMVYAGVQDAMIQWWYGHNAVGFFLTAGFLGVMYYFLPKQAQLPIYSYRLSIIHFWSLIFIYVWAGPHHLLYTALPEWCQTLGMTFSVVLLAPSWGGMINGLMTLRGAWDKLRTDPIIKFMFVAVSFYGMATFEGSMLAVRSVNAMSHYTDWTIGHVHAGALGWVVMISVGALYFMIPRVFGKTEMYSVPLINTHFWMTTIGTVLYIAAMWIAGIMQGLMWRAVNPDGGLTYTFAETVAAMHPYYLIRLVGGVIFLAGMFVMAYNVYRTITSPKPVAAPVPALQT
ncbi:MAG: cytochrome-c oxidase, cbb3-type subunit I [Candidatus Sericytochromatia bacterium]|nr:cytochrome-c oxidase, cbb3-type subunit I [Candidatus Sericytochromatia bacterium]